MVTTVQIQDDTLELLKKVKEETHSHSYDEAIKKLYVMRIKEKSLGGFLGPRPSKELLKDLRDKHDRY